MRPFWKQKRSLNWVVLGIQVECLALGLHLILIPKKKDWGFVILMLNKRWAKQKVDSQGIVHKYKVISKYAYQMFVWGISLEIKDIENRWPWQFSKVKFHFRIYDPQISLVTFQWVLMSNSTLELVIPKVKFHFRAYHPQISLVKFQWVFMSFIDSPEKSKIPSHTQIHDITRREST